MSAHTHAGHGDHHDHGHDHDDGHGESHGTMRDLIIGFVLSVILTVIPFWLVMARPIESGTLTAAIVLLLAAAQVVVHMVYFLHMNTRSEGGWNMMALVFTIIVVVICLAGSLWVMSHLNANMMADHTEMERR